MEAHEPFRTFAINSLRKMLTDYSKISNILLSYPERFYNEYDHLVEFYHSLIELIPNEIQIWIVTNNQSSMQKLKDRFSYKKINTIGIKGWDEIWLKDCIGFKKEGAVIKPYYHPSYCEYNEARHNSYFYKLNKLSKVIIRECITNSIIDLPLRLDGGNFVNNDRTCFLTEKILRDNKSFSASEVKSIIKDFMGLSATFLPLADSDTIGHADAYLGFLSSQKVFLSNYPSFSFLQKDIQSLFGIRKILEEEKFDIVEIQDRPIDEAVYCKCYRANKKACFSSARGNYSNFLRLNNLIVLPEYTLPTVKETKYFNSINKEILEREGFDICSLNCDQLAKLGGSLHCISYTF